MDVKERHILFNAVIADAARRLRARPIRDLIAAEVCDRARSSRICPNNVRETMTAAAS
jgi:hypothetical protein